MEGLAGCESLAKLDLTGNFIDAPGGLLSCVSLAANASLRHLYLTGNPCARSAEYRPFLLAVLPQLGWLDGAEVTPGERIAAQQARPHARRSFDRASRTAQSLPGLRAQLEAATASPGAAQEARARHARRPSPSRGPPAAGPGVRLVPCRAPARAPRGR